MIIRLRSRYADVQAMSLMTRCDPNNLKRIEFRGTIICRLYSHQPQRNYEPQTRSLRISGHPTSIRMELSFWDTLEEMAAKEDTGLAQFLTILHDEILKHQGEVENFASMLRCRCLIYRSTSASGKLYSLDSA